MEYIRSCIAYCYYSGGILQLAYSTQVPLPLWVPTMKKIKRLIYPTSIFSAVTTRLYVFLDVPLIVDEGMCMVGSTVYLYDGLQIAVMIVGNPQTIK